MSQSEVNKLDKKAELVIQLAFNMLMKGVLKKNVIQHFINKGISEKLSKDIVRAASERHNSFSYYKAV